MTTDIRQHILPILGDRLVACASLFAYKDVRAVYRRVLIGSILPITEDAFPRTFRVPQSDRNFWRKFAAASEDSVYKEEKNKLISDEGFFTITFGSIEELAYLTIILSA